MRRTAARPALGYGCKRNAQTHSAGQCGEVRDSFSGSAVAGKPSKLENSYVVTCPSSRRSVFLSLGLPAPAVERLEIPETVRGVDEPRTVVPLLNRRY